ncbi:MAG: hypothetical protein IIB19_07750 [Chloroflexi bacterium]|nr:hypothetical protein [Chloroflexota bacterium]
MKSCKACGAGPRTCPTILPLSFGPDAFFLRLEGGNEGIWIAWSILANSLCGNPDASVTFHQKTTGKIQVTVGGGGGVAFAAADYTPTEFVDLCKRIGRDTKSPPN